MANTSGKSAVLTYFDGRGRAELIRLMLEVSGVPYQERVITKALMEDLKQGEDLFFKQLPLLELDGLKLVQSVATVRYIARTRGMYGSSPLEAYQLDMIADGLADLKEHFIMFSDYNQRKAEPEAYDSRIKNTLLPRYLTAMERQLKCNSRKSENSHFLVGEKLSYADVALLEVLEVLEELYPGHVAATGHSLVASFHQNMREMPRVKDYLNSTRRHPPLNDTYIAHVREILPR